MYVANMIPNHQRNSLVLVRSSEANSESTIDSVDMTRMMLTGALAWTWSPPGTVTPTGPTAAISCSPVIDHNGNVIVLVESIEAPDSHVIRLTAYALRGDSGALLWASVLNGTYNTSHFISTSLSLGADGGVVVVASQRGQGTDLEQRLLALHAGGDVCWQQSLPLGTLCSLLGLGKNDDIVVSVTPVHAPAGYNMTVLAFDWLTGEVGQQAQLALWGNATDQPGCATQRMSQVLDADGVLYLVPTSVFTGSRCAFRAASGYATMVALDTTTAGMPVVWQQAATTEQCLPLRQAVVSAPSSLILLQRVSIHQWQLLALVSS